MGYSAPSDPRRTVESSGCVHAKAGEASDRPDFLDPRGSTGSYREQHVRSAVSVPPAVRVRRCVRCRGLLKQSARRPFHDNCWWLERHESRVD